MQNVEFYICKHCKNLVGMIHNAGIPIICCGEKMSELVPGSIEASEEKHIPEVTVEGNIVKVQIGSVEHPMVDEHYIEWIYLQTDKGGQRTALEPGDAPNVQFALINDKPVAVYAYCNIHGLWKKDIK